MTIEERAWNSWYADHKKGTAGSWSDKKTKQLYMKEAALWTQFENSSRVDAEIAKQDNSSLFNFFFGWFSS